MKNNYRIILSDASLKENILTVKEFEEFSDKFPEIAELLLNPDNFKEQLNDMEKDEVGDWQNTAILILDSLWKYKGSNIFHSPVDPVRLGMR